MKIFLKMLAILFINIYPIISFSQGVKAGEMATVCSYLLETIDKDEKLSKFYRNAVLREIDNERFSKNEFTQTLVFLKNEFSKQPQAKLKGLALECKKPSSLELFR